MMNKNYTSLKTGLFMLAGSVLSSAGLTAQVIQTYSYTGGLQSFLVPNCVSSLTIEARGAQGGTLTSNNFYVGGLGSTMKGVFTPAPGTLLNIIVGGQGKTSDYTSGGGGASGVGNGNTPLIVAGGGGGVDYQNPNYSGMNAVTGTSGNPGNNSGGAGGTGGSNGGDLVYTQNDISRGGRGWSFNNAGSFGDNGISNGQWTTNGSWGLGGGGGSVGEGYCNCGGGGGGYSGGGAGQINTSGGGGGSYNSGTSQVNTAGNNSGDGLVIISFNYTGGYVTGFVAGTGSICPGQQITLSAGGSVNSFTWSENNSNFPSINVSPNVTTSYTLSGTNSNGCVTSTVLTVALLPTPTVSALPASNFICLGGIATLTASGASIYAWDNNMTGSVVAVSPVTNTVYNVIGTSALGCTNTAMVAVTVNSLMLTATANTAICLGKQVVLTANGANANSYTWSDANGGSPFQTITPSPTVSTTYTASGTDANNCVITTTVLVTVNANPTVTAQASKTVICKGQSAVLTGNGASTYSWSASAGSSTSASVTVTPPLNTVYDYSVTGTDANGCTGYGNVSVKVDLCTGISEFQNNVSELSVYPNPNNGSFTIRAANGSNLMIINSLGELIKTVTVSETDAIVVSDLAKGVYFITGINRGLKINKKIIVN